MDRKGPLVVFRERYIGIKKWNWRKRKGMVNRDVKAAKIFDAGKKVG